MEKYRIIRNDVELERDYFFQGHNLVYIGDFIDDANFAVITHHTVVIKGNDYIINLIELFRSISDIEPMIATTTFDTIEKYITYAEQIV